ncbi:Eco57I restriction-modification methylase [Corynebacterium mycetoides]|uniref:Eco57I restriction-modification methylase n=1 Tax=Corynebacterium mycetoides TaxID=38302 RepID=A0A1G9MUX7_9CORY|nr:Eco57I restriction-modification methylase domain-containing protein [Corynebacterium mycetoides]SDL78029.1 Eco57I restriction-modification methylase [Corynebacterium mycetoides]
MTVKKFDVVIGNPPYQQDGQGASTRSEPIYPAFMDAAYEVGDKVVLITPARFLSNSGQTKSIWNRKMLADKHLKVAIHTPDSSTLFPGTAIKGGIAVTYRDNEKEIGPIGTFLGSAEALRDVIEKVGATAENSLFEIVSSRALYRYSKLALSERPEIAAKQGKGTGNQVTPPSIEVLKEVVFFDEIPADGNEYVEVIGVVAGSRVTRWIRTDYLVTTPSLNKWKTIIARTNNTGAFGETLSSPFVGKPGLGHTDTFLSVGPFESKEEAEACLRYIKTKFSRALLSILKTTQDTPRGKWKYVPLQDFSSSSDIDWEGSIPEIDRQLYTKYGLSEEEIDFIEENVKPME